MLRLVIIATLLGVCLGLAQIPTLPRQNTRIVGGEPANIEDIPYQLSLQFSKDKKHQCGASIISEYYAVTAAHCTHGLHGETFNLRAGSSIVNESGSLHLVKEIIEHENSSDSHARFDIAILKVQNPFLFDTKVQPIPLAETTPSAGAPVVVSGWGRLTLENHSPPIELQKVYLVIVEHTVCEVAYKPLTVTDDMLCAGVPDGGKGGCRGDSGGPLVAGGELVGVVSWSNPCAVKGCPDVYADVAVQRSWIKTHTGI